MRPFQKADGSVNISSREYDIATSTQIKKGQVVKIASGLVVLASATETGNILGVAAENHSGSADALNPRANGKKILVFDCPDAIFASKVPTFEATGGSATTITTDELGAFSNDDFNGGYVKLIKKAAGSTNTDPIGAVKQITDYGYNATGTVSTFTVASGGTANDGDVYELYPPVGLTKGTLDEGISNYKVSAASCNALRVVGRDENMGEVHVIPVKHTLGK